MLYHELALKCDELFLLVESPQTVSRAPVAGLSTRDTRHLNSIQVGVDGQTPELLATSNPFGLFRPIQGSVASAGLFPPSGRQRSRLAASGSDRE